MKKITGIITALILLPLILDISIMFANDIIANIPEKTLLDIALPEKTQLIESGSVAGKRYGNGNGMQYIGVMVVTTELTAEKLEAYYHGINEDIIVYNSETTENKNAYTIELVKYNPGTFDSYLSENFFWKVLDWDIRGH